MYNAAARQGRLLSRAWRLIPSSSSSSAAAFTRPIPPASRLPPSAALRARCFSSALQSRFQAEAAQPSDFAEQDISHQSRDFTQFQELADNGVIDPRVISTLVNNMGIHTMTEVQRMTINECLDGSDVIAQARTGTGKTLAFLMPIVQRALRDPHVGKNVAHIGDTRALILSPTRELAEQIADEAVKLVRGTGLQVQSAVGGTQKAYYLRRMQRMGSHILVGTPGRVLDLLSDPYSGLRMDNLDTFVLDEADRLLDIGFGPAIKEIQSFLPSPSERPRQTLMFSATIPRSVVGVVKETLRPNFKFVRTIDPNEAPTHDKIPQKVLFLPGLQNQVPAIAEIAMKAINAHKQDPAETMPFKAIVFFRSVNEVNLAYNIFQNFRAPGQLRGGPLRDHPLAPCTLYQMTSRLTQKERSANTASFRQAKSAIMFASDVAARGMDFPNVSHVIQVGLPSSMDDYIHRLGRTGRAGKPGNGYIILQDDERNEFRKWKTEANIQNIDEDSSIATATLDMTQPSQLAAETARVMAMVESGIRSTPFPDKHRTYVTTMSVLSQSPVRRSKQAIVDMTNDLARFGWGIVDRMPQMDPRVVAKLGLSGCRGLELVDDFARAPRATTQVRRSLREEDYDINDPFGQGLSGKGTSSGGFGSSRYDRDRPRDRPRDGGSRRSGTGFGGRRQF